MNKRGRGYSEEQKALIIANYGKIPTSEIASKTGLTVRNIVKWMATQRKVDPSISIRTAKVGEIRRNWSKTHRAFVLKQKQANGKWKHIGYEGHEDKKGGYISALPIGSVRECKGGKKRIKTEKGWRYVKKPESEKKKAGGIRPKIYKAGDKVIRKHAGQMREFIRQEDMRWKIVPIQFISKVTREPKEPLIPNIGKVVKSNKTLPRNDPQRPKNSLDASKNPKEVKIMSDAEKIAVGYRYIQVDHKTRVLRHPSKLTEEQKTA